MPNFGRTFKLTIRGSWTNSASSYPPIEIQAPPKPIATCPEVLEHPLPIFHSEHDVECVSKYEFTYKEDNESPRVTRSCTFGGPPGPGGPGSPGGDDGGPPPPPVTVTLIFPRNDWEYFIEKTGVFLMDSRRPYTTNERAVSSYSQCLPSALGVILYNARINDSKNVSDLHCFKYHSLSMGYPTAYTSYPTPEVIFGLPRSWWEGNGCPIWPSGTIQRTTLGGSSIHMYKTCEPPITELPRGVWHLTTSDGRFLQSYATSAGVYVKWWDYSLPRGTTNTVLVDAGTDYYQCRVCEDTRNRIHAVIGKIAGSTFTCHRSHSDDGGKTWSTLTDMGITNGRWPTTSSSRHGDMYEAAFVFDSGSSGPGEIKLRGKSPGQASYGTVLTAKDSTGADLKFKDGSFHLSPTPDAANRIVLTAVIDGETEPSSWFSTDILSGGATFTRF